MADTVIAPDLNEHWKQVLASEEQDVPAITIDVCVLRTLIERCSKAEQERDALRAEIERLKAKVVRLEAATFAHAALIEAASVAVHGASLTPIEPGDTAVVVRAGMGGSPYAASRAAGRCGARLCRRLG